MARPLHHRSWIDSVWSTPTRRKKTKAKTARAGTTSAKGHTTRHIPLPPPPPPPPLLPFPEKWFSSWPSPFPYSTSCVAFEFSFPSCAPLPWWWWWWKKKKNETSTASYAWRWGAKPGSERPTKRTVLLPLPYRHRGVSFPLSALSGVLRALFRFSRLVAVIDSPQWCAFHCHSFSPASQRRHVYDAFGASRNAPRSHADDGRWEEKKTFGFSLPLSADPFFHSIRVRSEAPDHVGDAPPERPEVLR